ncbi:copper resistance CopC/CopD family protein [Solirubrobacter soli]|uniref:copper resistance CopC/CopD family protein n=1 Tax=Solirubrobacter soli TaxID=363832 RepID=UPI0012F7216B|nr:copper resistance protein CopC [Solirubrobacter soli]
MPRRGPFLAVLAFAFAFAALAPDAGAHAALVRSTPADGSSLARAPREIRLRFSEAISPRFRVVRVIDDRGRPVARTRVTTDAARGLTVHVPALPRGSYQVVWEVLADDDGHVTGGALAFGVRARPLAARAASAGTAPAALEAALRSLDLALLVGLIGTLAMSALLARVRSRAPAAAERAQRRLLAGAGIAAGAGALIGLLLLARQMGRVGTIAGRGATVADVLATRWGALWLGREAVLFALAGAALWLRAPRGSRAVALLTTVLVVTLAAIRALSGHAAAASRPGLQVAVASAHILAAGAWMGGVVAFGMALAAARGEAGALARACRGPFSRAAGLSIVVLAVTGLLAAGAQVASVDALLTTDYGHTLIAKSLLVVTAAGLGLANARALRRGALPRVLRVEAGAGAGALLAAAVLTASPPAKGPEFAAPRPVVAPTLARQAGDLLVTATARPNRAGPNVFSVLAVSSRRPPPAPVTGVELRLTPPGGRARDVALAALGQGRFAGGAELDTDGRWRMTAVIARGTRRVTVPFGWTVAAPDPARPVTYSARPLAPLFDRAAALLALLVAGAGAAAVGLRRARGGRARSPLIEPLGKEAS